MAVDLSVRRFRTADAEVIADLVQRCLWEVNGRDYSEDVIRTMCARYTASRFLVLATERRVYVAENASTAVGTVSLDDNFVHTMFVDPEQSGLGVGRRLMEHVERCAAAEGHGRMMVNASVTARGFYTRLGYTELSTSDGEYGRTHRMHKPLRAGSGANLAQHRCSWE